MRLFGTPAGTKMMLLTMLIVLVGLAYQVSISFKLETVSTPPSQVVVADNRQFRISSRQFATEEKAELKKIPKNDSNSTKDSTKGSPKKNKTPSSQANKESSNQDGPLKRIVRGVSGLLGL